MPHNDAQKEELKLEIERLRLRKKHFSKCIIKLRVICSFSKETQQKNINYWNKISIVTGLEQISDIEGLLKILDNQKTVMKARDRNQHKIETLKQTKQKLKSELNNLIYTTGFEVKTKDED
jgi:hypothetical protein